jgi:hypothetical protein
MDAKNKHQPTDHSASVPDEAAASEEGGTPPPVVRIEKSRIEEEEMGGEAPCQLHNFWDADAEE